MQFFITKFDNHPEHGDRYFFAKQNGEYIEAISASMIFVGDREKAEKDGWITSINDWKVVSFETPEQCLDAVISYEILNTKRHAAASGGWCDLCDEEPVYTFKNNLFELSLCKEHTTKETVGRLMKESFDKSDYLKTTIK